VTAAPPSRRGAPTRTGSTGQRQRALGLIEAHVDDALRPFLTTPGKHAWAPAGVAGCVIYGRAGSTLVTIGDPIGPDGWVAFDRLVTHCHRRGVRIGLYQATDAALPALSARGFRAIAVGQEALVDLRTFDLSGSGRANLRHTVSRARRGGVSVGWHPRGITRRDAGLLAELAALDREWSELAGPPMGFTISRFDADRGLEGPVAVASDASGAIVAMASFRTCGPGATVLDLIRRRPGGVPGALESCIATAATALAEAGGTTLSLGLAPLAGLDPAGPVAEERLLARAAGVAGTVYDVNGLTFFKDKFAPRWRTRWLAVPTDGTPWPIAAALVRLHLADPGVSPATATVGIVAGIARMTRASARAWWREHGAAAIATMRERAFVAAAAGTAAGVGARLSSGSGTRFEAGLAGAGLATVALVGIGARRARTRDTAMGSIAPDGNRLPGLAVLIPARDEQDVLPTLIRDLAAQTGAEGRGRSAFEVVVIDDRSSDQTMHRALAAARDAGIADLVSVQARRGRDLADGKGAALAAVVLPASAELVVVLDADARLGPTALDGIARRAAAGYEAFTLRRAIDTSSRSWLAQAQADEQVIDAAIESARSGAGAAQFRGNGMVIRRDTLDAIGGFRAAVTEDLDLSSRLTARFGRGVAWPASPAVGEQPVLDIAALWSQRVRWSEGALRACAAWVPRQVVGRGIPLRVRADRAGYAIQLAIPFAALGAAMAAIRRGDRRRALAIPVASTLIAGAICFDALGANASVGDANPAGAADRVLRSGRAGIFVLLWYAAVPRAALRIVLGRGPLAYRKTRHVSTEPGRAPGTAT
jgi:hypothetical protein